MGDVMNQPDTNENLTVALRRMHRWRMAFFGLVLMISGCVLGAAVTVMVVQPGERRPSWMDPDKAAARMALRLKDELGLTGEQEEKIRAVFQTHMEELEALREAARPKIEAAMQSLEKQVDAVLTKEQRDQLQEMMDNMKRELRRGMGRGRPGPGGPGRFDDHRGPFPGPGEEGGPGDRRGDSYGPRGRRGLRGRRDPNAPKPLGPPPVEPNKP